MAGEWHGHDMLCVNQPLLVTHSIRLFPLHFSSRALPRTITFQLNCNGIRDVPFNKTIMSPSFGANKGSHVGEHEDCRLPWSNNRRSEESYFLYVQIACSLLHVYLRSMRVCCLFRIDESSLFSNLFIYLLVYVCPEDGGIMFPRNINKFSLQSCAP
jgi:hypothetical protein